MKLVLYSGGFYEDNRTLDRRLIELTGKKTPSITYIPSSSDYGIYDFPDFLQNFRQYKIENFLYFPVDIPITEELLMHAFGQDIIFLSGGNTFYFLKSLKRQKLQKHFKEFFEQGGVLAGLSAGAIITTPTIMTATFPPWDRDPNIVRLKNLKSYNFADFEFFPHYEDSNKYRKAMIEHSQSSGFPLFACCDNSGVIVKDHAISAVGECWVFTNGHYFKYQNR